MSKRGDLRALDVQRAAARAAAYADARRLANELAGRSPRVSLDPQPHGVQMLGSENLHRVGYVWFRQLIDGVGVPSWSRVFLTDQRILVRLATGELTSLWWAQMAGFTADLTGDGVAIADFGDFQPREMVGPYAALIAVEGVAVIYGRGELHRIERALVNDETLAPLHEL